MAKSASFLSASLPRNVLKGLTGGIAMAGVYCAYSLVLYVIQGSDPFDKNQVSLLGVLLAYVSAGAIGGSIVGALLPISRWFLGTIALAMIAAVVLMFSVGIATDGPFWRWDSDIWERTWVLGALFGGVLGILIWRSSRAR